MHTAGGLLRGLGVREIVYERETESDRDYAGAIAGVRATGIERGPEAESEGQRQSQDSDGAVRMVVYLGRGTRVGVACCSYLLSSFVVQSCMLLIPRMYHLAAPCGIRRGQKEAPETMGLLAALPGDVSAGLFQAVFAS